MNWIDEILVGLVESVSNNVYEILNELNIYYFAVDPDSSVLKGNLAVYNRIGSFECIYYSNDIINKEYVLAHEIGHAILHVEESEMFYNPLLNKGKLEKEADYFATKLLYSNLEIEDGIETYEQLANLLGIKEDNIKYIIKE
ncbi:ImmA/IrrE family metallo-endopeptidase [Helcococcus kunzii]|uniref:ImmA/IrrE family metallo-endopeptidase n=1 Tax=Helcococcus kunzii TaxID=40091 RepID=UPI001BAEEA13|nr:ImmA/IrrE family metallo-endopeptidase [Helcococcus kunzii]QUY65124.1 ImmA/IrrE family metallo-endopeptidase [Helcococcus kunzii]